MAEQDPVPVTKLRIDRPAPQGSSSPGGNAAGHRFSRRRIVRLALLVAGIMVLIAIVHGALTQPVQVETATVGRLHPSQGRQLLIASGYVVAQRKAAVASKGTGRLVALNVVEGDRVHAGDVLARIESADVDAAAAQARAMLEQSRAALIQAEAEARDAATAFKRMGSLLSKGSVSQSDFDVAEARNARATAGVTLAQANVRAADAALRAASIQIENTYIRAPFSGTVLMKNADVGEIVAPFGASANARGAVVTMADMSSLEVEADVSESQIQNVRADQPCEITLDAYPDVRYAGRVSKIVPTADRSKATVLTKIRFEELDHRVLPEMSAKVSFLSEPLPKDSAARAPRIVVHPDALVTRSGSPAVFVVTDGRAHLRPVRLSGDTIGTMRVVTSGITVGETIILSPPADLDDGADVSVGKK